MSAANLNDELEAVRRELAEVKKQLAVHQARTTDVSKADGEGATTSAFRFLDLPRALRDEIYKLCVVPGKVYIYHANTVKTHDFRITSVFPPELQLFRVCKQISKETRDLFTEENLFVLMSGPCTTISTLHTFLYAVDTKLLRRLSLSFDWRDYAAISVNEAVTNRYRSMRKPEWCSEDEYEPTMLYAMQHQMITDIWYPLLTAIRHIKLDYLQLNVQNCCRATGMIHYPDIVLDLSFSPISKHEAAWLTEEEESTTILKTLMELTVKVVDIVGTRNSRQRCQFRYLLEKLPGELQFHGGKGCINHLGLDEWDEQQAVVEYEIEESLRFHKAKNGHPKIIE